MTLADMLTLETCAEVEQLLRTICGSRRFLLKVVLAGRKHWTMAFLKHCHGLPVDETTAERLWAYFVAQAGPSDREHLKAELGLLLEQQEAEQAVNDVAWDIERWDGAKMDPMGKPH